MTKLSDLKSQQYLRDKQNVLEWYRKYALGHLNVKSRDKVLPFILTHKSPMDTRDRYLREITSDLIHEGHLASLSGKGTWAVPLSTNNGEEIKALRHSILERRDRAMASLADCDRQLKAVEAKMEPQLV